MSNTVRFLRILKAPVDRVYRAFTDPDAVIRWQPPFGYIGQVHEWDFKVGGGYQMSFINFANGQGHRFGGKFVEITENEKIVATDAFDDPALAGDMRTTTRLRAVANGTEVSVEQTGIPDAIPLEFCYAGWHESMLQLAQLVEPDSPEDPTAS